MNNNISALNRRLQTIETESEFARRKCEEEVQKAYKALKEITQEDVELLSPIVPGIKLIVNYTVDDLRSNKNGELNVINTVMAQLRDYLEARLTFYEEQL